MINSAIVQIVDLCARRRWTIAIAGVLLMLGAGGGGFAWFQMQRRAAIKAAAPPRKERPPEGLDMKEPAGHGPDTVLPV